MRLIKLPFTEAPLLSPAGARAVTDEYERLLHYIRVAVPRRGASCYDYSTDETQIDDGRVLSPAGARAVTL